MKKTALCSIIFMIVIFFAGCQENYYNPEVTESKTSNSELTYIRLAETSVFLEIGDCISLQAEIVSESTEKIHFKSSDSSIVNVDESGMIYAVSSGNAVITASTESGLEAKCNAAVNGLRKMNINGFVPLTALDGDEFNFTIDFDNCKYPSLKIVADCGGGTISCKNKTYTFEKDNIQYSTVGETSVSFKVTNNKEYNLIRIAAFDCGEMIDIKEFIVTKPLPDINAIINRLNKLEENIEAIISQDH